MAVLNTLKYIVLIVLYVYVLPLNAAVYVQLEASPPAVVKNLTSHLSVTCTLPASANVEFSAVSSLILSRAPPGVNSVFHEVAGITSGSKKADVMNTTAHQATGEISTGKDNFINAKVLDPGNDGPGVYRCEVFGLDTVGHPLTTSSTTRVDLTSISTDALLAMVQALQQNNDDCKMTTTMLSDQLSKYQANTTLLLENIKNLQGGNMSGLFADLTLLKADTASLLHNVTDCKAQTSTLSSMVASIQSGTADLSNDISNIKANQTALSNDLHAYQSSTGTLTGDVDKNEADIASLSKELGYCRSNTSSLVGQVSQYQTSVTSLSNDLNNYKSNTSYLMSEVSKCQMTMASVLKDVAECKSNTSTLVSDVSKLQSSTSNLQNQLNQHVSDYTALSNQFDTFKQNTTNSLELIKTEIKDIQILITQYPGTNATNNMNTTNLAQYGGHFYSLTNVTYVNISAGVDVCRAMKGYLIEINDRGEWEFAKNYMDSIITDTRDYIMVGASDNGHEGSWTYVTSKGPVTFLAWSTYTHQVGEYFNCMYLHHELGGWWMASLSCDNHYGRILCEIPPP